jgi:hypothetical protein
MVLLRLLSTLDQNKGELAKIQILRLPQNASKCTLGAKESL